MEPESDLWAADTVVIGEVTEGLAMQEAPDGMLYRDWVVKVESYVVKPFPYDRVIVRIWVAHGGMPIKGPGLRQGERMLLLLSKEHGYWSPPAFGDNEFTLAGGIWSPHSYVIEDGRARLSFLGDRWVSLEALILRIKGAEWELKRAKEIALSDAQVRGELAGKDYEVREVYRLDEELPAYSVAIYLSGQPGITLRVGVDLTNGMVRSICHELRPRQLSAQEGNEARRIALADAEVKRLIGNQGYEIYYVAESSWTEHHEGKETLHIFPMVEVNMMELNLPAYRKVTGILRVFVDLGAGRVVKIAFSPSPGLLPQPTPALTPTPVPGPVPLAEVVTAVRPSVVLIRHQWGTSSGFVFSRGGLALTSAHVGGTGGLGVNRRVKVVVGDRREFAPVSIAWDEGYGIAVAKLPQGDIPALVLGDSDKVAEGDEVHVLGYPLDSGLGQRALLTSGFVSGTKVPGPKEDLDYGTRYIQIDARINPGQSGAPVLNGRGEVIGIATARTFGVEGKSLAIPINSVKSRMRYLAEGGLVAVPTPRPTLTPTLTPTPTPIPGLSPNVVYFNETFGYTITYPRTWGVDSRVASVVGLTPSWRLVSIRVNVEEVPDQLSTEEYQRRKLERIQADAAHFQLLSSRPAWVFPPVPGDEEESLPGREAAYVVASRYMFGGKWVVGERYKYSLLSVVRGNKGLNLEIWLPQRADLPELSEADEAILEELRRGFRVSPVPPTIPLESYYDWEGGFSVGYPKGWEKTTYRPQDAAAQFSGRGGWFTVTRKILPQPTTTEDYWEALQAELRSSPNYVRSLSTKWTDIQNIPAVDHEYVQDEPRGRIRRIRLRVVVLVKDNVALLLQFGIPMAPFAEIAWIHVVDTFDAIADSVRFLR